MQEVLPFLTEHFGTLAFWIPTIIVIIVIQTIIDSETLKKFFISLPLFYKRATIAIFLGLTIILYNKPLWNLFWLKMTGGMIVICSTLSMLVLYLKISFNLKKIVTLSEPRSYKYREENALHIINKLSPSKMTKKQKVKYGSHKIYVFIKLGSLRSAEKIMQEVGSDNLGLAHFHFLNYIVAYHKGDNKLAHEEIKNATDMKDKDTEPLLQVQILANLGYSYNVQKNYSEAQKYYLLAIKAYRELGIKNKSLLNIVYTNHVLNASLIDNEVQTLEAIADEYKSFLNLKRSADIIDYFNIKLRIYRQLNVPKEKIKEIIDDLLEKFVTKRRPLKDQVMLAGSLSRIVWSHMLNPEPGLSILSDNYQIIETFPPFTRYIINKDLALLFNDLHGEMPTKYSVLRSKALDYMTHRAIKDLTEYRNSLPEQSILARCLALKELAGTTIRNQDFDSNHVLSLLNEAVALLHDNYLFLEEINFRLDIIDELLSSENQNIKFMILNDSIIRQNLNEIDSRLPGLLHHPIRAELDIRLSFYYLQLHEYNKCIEFYNAFTQSLISINHLAPWLHLYRMQTAVAVRVLYFKKTIHRLKNSDSLLAAAPNVQKWFHDFPKLDGIFESVLLARFMGFESECLLKRKKWQDSNLSGPEHIHGWFYFWPLHLNIDITYDQFSEEEHPHHVFFFDHPFETNESVTLIKSGVPGEELPKDVELYPAGSPPEQSKEFQLFSSIYDLITQNIPSECPSVPYIQKLYQETIMPTPVQ